MPKNCGNLFVLNVNLAFYLYFFAYASILFFFLVVFLVGISMALFVAPQRSPSAYIPMWIPYLSVPVASGLMIIQTIVLILRQIKLPEDE